MTEKRIIYWMNDEVWRGKRKVAMNVEGSWGESMPPHAPLYASLTSTCPE
jgi:hypothetical protein